MNRMHFKSASILRTALLAGTMIFAVPAVAQDAASGREVPKSDASTDGDIIVTAQRRSESIQNVPIAINAFGEDELERARLDSVPALTSRTAGLTFAEMSGVGRISLRGVGFGVQTGAGDGAVALHRDGIYISPTGASMMAQLNLSRIEVLRGPQGTLYGRNSTGGVVNYISKAPSDQFEGEAMVGYGNLNRTGRAAVSGPIAPGWAVRLTGDFNDQGGYVRNLTTGNKIGGSLTKGVTLGVDGNVTDSFRVELRGLYAKQRFDGPVSDPLDDSVIAAGVNSATYSLDDNSVRLSYDPYFNRKLHIVSAALIFDVAPGITLKSLTGHVEFKSQYRIDADGTSQNLLDLNPGRIDDRMFSQEFTLNGSTDFADFVVGLYYTSQDIDKSTSTATPGLLGVGVANIRNAWTNDAHNYAAFFDVTKPLTDRLKLFGGLRYLRDEQNTSLRTTTTLASGTALQTCANDFRLRDDSVTGRAGLQYNFDSRNMIYGQYSVGYKAGGSAPSGCNNIFKPETLKSTEVGIKTSPASGWTFNASAYYYDYRNSQIPQAVGTVFRVNNTDARLWGLDLETRARVAEGFSLRGAATVLRSKFVNFLNVDQMFPGSAAVDLSGRRTLFSPKWSFSAGAEYEVLLSGGATLLFDAGINGSARYKLREFGVDGDNVPSFVTGEASITYTAPDERFYVRAWGKNLADKQQHGGVDVEPTFPGVSTGPYRIGPISMPRTYGIEVGTKF